VGGDNFERRNSSLMHHANAGYNGGLRLGGARVLVSRIRRCVLRYNPRDRQPRQQHNAKQLNVRSRQRNPLRILLKGTLSLVGKAEKCVQANTDCSHG
jgi:hypothetical protein